MVSAELPDLRYSGSFRGEAPINSCFPGVSLSLVSAPCHRRSGEWDEFEKLQSFVIQCLCRHRRQQRQREAALGRPVYQTLPSPPPGFGQPHFSSQTRWDARPHTSLRASLPTVCLCPGPLALGGRWDAWGSHAAAACTSTQKQGPRRQGAALTSEARNSVAKHPSSSATPGAAAE